MKQHIDLHLHTVFSDGTNNPRELLDIVRSKNISVFSVTDHDNLDGYRAMKKLVNEDDPILISGIEFSTTYDGADMHILAYLFDAENGELNEAIKLFQDNRKQRGEKMVEKLNQLGIEISYDQVLKQADGASVGRPHVARALVDAKAVNQYDEAFYKYISDSGPAYVPKENFTPKETINLIHKSGGLAFLAHPGVGEKEKHIEYLIECGLDGIEAYHPNHKMPDVDRYKHLADRYRLLVSGGSDYHGISESHGSVGSQKVPVKYYERMIENLN
jgi:hypothetical protein